MKWYDSSNNNIKIEKIPYRLLKVNDEVCDSIFERDGEYYLSIKCGIDTYSRNHGYENFVTDGFKIIYELPKNLQKEIKIDLNNIKNFLQENKTIISSIPGSDILLTANIETEYIAHRELNNSLLIKYDNYSIKDFPMDKRNYDQKILIERLINNSDNAIGYEKEGKYYIDIKENKKYLEIIKDGQINKTLKTDGNSIELPSTLGSDTVWETVEGKDIAIENTVEGESLKIIELWGDTWQDTNNYEVQSIGDLYVDDEGQPILDNKGRQQYAVNLYTSNQIFNSKQKPIDASIETGNIEITAIHHGWNIKSKKNDSYQSVAVKIKNLVPNREYRLKAKAKNHNKTQIDIYMNNGVQGEFKNETTSDINLDRTFIPTQKEVSLNLYITKNAGIGNVDFTDFIVSESDNVIENLQYHTTQILLPCQLMKVGNIADKLYWDEEEGKYVIEKKIGKYNNFSSLGTYTELQTIRWYQFGKDRISNDKNKDAYGNNSYIINNFKNVTYNYHRDDKPYIYDSWHIHAFSFLKSKTLDEIKTYLNDNSYILYQAQVPEIIETDITEQISVTCHNKKTYLYIAGLSPFWKATAPVDVNNVNQILLARKNNFDSILNVTLNPNHSSSITLFEGGLDLQLSNGVDILPDGNVSNSNLDGHYASRDFIDLVSYNLSTFTIDILDLNLPNLYIYYYNNDKQFIQRELINFKTKSYKTSILYPVGTRFCKVAFVLDNVISDYYKVRILRDKYLEQGFKPLTHQLINNEKYVKSFSFSFSIKHDIERLIVFLSDDNYSVIDEFSIINNLESNQKIHSFEVPQKLEPGEILSYSKSGQKQFLYKYSNNIPYNSIVDVNYNRPYVEYHNIVNNYRFELFKFLNTNGNVDVTKEPYCAIEEYIDISAYRGNTITLSVASLMTATYISFYGEKKGHIIRHNVSKNYLTVTVPNNAYYMRCGCYVKTLGGETSDTKELIQKHVMVTTTNFRCDYIPYGVNYPHTLIPDIRASKQYDLELNAKSKYLLIEPYKFDYSLKDLNSLTEEYIDNSGKWRLDRFSKNGVNGNYANLDDIKREPLSTSVITTPSYISSGAENTLLAYTKYVKTTAAFNHEVTMTIDDYATFYLNGNLLGSTTLGTKKLVIPFKKGYNELIILVINNGGTGGLTITPDITTALSNVETVGSEGRLVYDSVVWEDNCEVKDVFFHNIIEGKIIEPLSDLYWRLDASNNDKFILSKDFSVNADYTIDGYINTGVVTEDENSKTYINRVYGGEQQLTLLTVGGNVCEIYFLNDYIVNSGSYCSLYAKYNGGNQKILIDQIPDNARYIAIVTDKKNMTNNKCSGIYMFPGHLDRRMDTTSEYFKLFKAFNQEIAKLSYSSDVSILKNKMPNLSKLLLDDTKHLYDEDNNRYIFPLQLEENCTNYFLQYWNDKPINFLNIFIDSNLDINSDTKQYLVNHTMNNETRQYLEISNDILTSLQNNILYLSVSIANSNKLTIYDFLINGSYKLQLEKDSFSNEFEPYTEIIEHHPMYLTANGLTIESSSSYYGIRKLEPPKNIMIVTDNGLSTITWNNVVGATSYILYLDGKPLDSVTSPFYETMAEIKGLITIRAKNSLTESELSEAVFIHSVPTNPYIIYIDNEYMNEQYNFHVYFKDNSDIETGYRVRYQIDNRQEVRIDLPASPGVGGIVEANFSAITILEQVIVRITSINEKGENELASQFILKLPPEVLWTYNDNTKQIVLAWSNIFPECTEYAIRYKKKNDEIATTIKIPNIYEENARIRHAIDLDPDDEMELSVTGVKEEIYYVFTKPKKVSKALDLTALPPENFRSKKISNDTVEFSWTDSTTMENGWELSYSLNNSSPKTIVIPTTSKDTTDKTYKYEYTFPDHGFINAKLRMTWELNNSNYTEEITNYYFPIDNVPPTGLRKQYSSTTSMLIEWDSQAYVDSYDISITKNGKNEVINTKENSYNLMLNDKVLDEYEIKVKTNFLGEQYSEYTEPLTFKPTWSGNDILSIMCTNCKDLYANTVKSIDEIRDVFFLATKSTNKASWNFALTTLTTNKFYIYDGLISTETWYTGQKTVYNNTMEVKNTNVIMTDTVLNTVNYQVTEYDGHYIVSIYTPSSTSGKIVMEINKTRIVCIGDSITAGHPGFWAESMTGEITHQYPYWLDRRLKFQYEVINKGYGSDRTYNVLNRFQKDVLDLSPQYCLIQIGTNDIYWGAASADGSTEAFDSSTLADMKKNVMTMVELCFQNNIVPILGMLIPRTQVVTDPVVKHGLYAFNDWIVEYANTTEGVNYVDFFNAGKDKIPPTPLEDPSSPGAMNPIYDGDNVYDEQGNLVKYGAGIHLNAVGYRIMAEAIPLNLFTTIENGVKMYMDEKCTIEANYNIEDKQNPFYEIEIEGMKLTRTKKIVRYIKNIGNTQVLFSIYPNDLYNLDYNFKFKETDEGSKTISGILTPGNSIAVRMELTPLTEDSKSFIELSLVSREFSIET